jgi:hypothetical protein
MINSNLPHLFERVLLNSGTKCINLWKWGIKHSKFFIEEETLTSSDFETIRIIKKVLDKEKDNLNFEWEFTFESSEESSGNFNLTGVLLKYPELTYTSLGSGISHTTKDFFIFLPFVLQEGEIRIGLLNAFKSSFNEKEVDRAGDFKIHPHIRGMGISSLRDFTNRMKQGDFGHVCRGAGDTGLYIQSIRFKTITEVDLTYFLILLRTFFETQDNLTGTTYFKLENLVDHRITSVATIEYYVSHTADVYSVYKNAVRNDIDILITEVLKYATVIDDCGEPLLEPNELSDSKLIEFFNSRSTLSETLSYSNYGDPSRERILFLSDARAYKKRVSKVNNHLLSKTERISENYFIFNKEKVYFEYKFEYGTQQNSIQEGVLEESRYTININLFKKILYDYTNSRIRILQKSKHSELSKTKQKVLSQYT